MNHSKAGAGIALIAIALLLGGCAKTDTTTTTTAAATDAPTGDAASTAASAPPADVPPADAARATPAAIAFTDLAGVNGAQQITGFAQLGVVDPTSGAFRPAAPVKRREFIRWLVKANNALWADTPAKLVNRADTTEKSSFADVATSDPDFAYIQGMQDAGYSVGFPDGTFKPDAPLTREQMFSIKNVFDKGTVDAGLAKGIDYARNTAMAPWKDRAAISRTYVPGIATGDHGGADSFALVFGTSSLFHPQFPVTRAQAAVAMSTIADHSMYGSAKRTLAQTLAAPTPTP